MPRKTVLCSVLLLSLFLITPSRAAAAPLQPDKSVLTSQIRARDQAVTAYVTRWLQGAQQAELERGAAQLVTAESHLIILLFDDETALKRTSLFWDWEGAPEPLLGRLLERVYGVSLEVESLFAPGEE